MTFPFHTPEPVTLSIRGSEDIFPVNHIYCVGRNYAAHAKEMEADDRQPPFFFSKSDWAVTSGDVDYPADTNDLQHEVELVIAVGEEMSVFGFGVGVDLTRRDIQGQAKKDSKPWFRGKSFPGSAPVSKIIPLEKRSDYSDLNLVLSVNGELKQSGSCRDMIWSPPEILCELAADVPLQAGDLIFTGTPEGVGPLAKGDQVIAAIPGEVELSFSIL
ncbi:MAG: fumarylacetoacetate hydrolase family protein [Candidatus Marinimicrobia bacterium]|nr:fumarylacetoacetate hydrolase family protein [Candidatus Neomarinimicrobiota bacterium]